MPLLRFQLVIIPFLGPGLLHRVRKNPLMCYTKPSVLYIVRLVWLQEVVTIGSPITMAQAVRLLLLFGRRKLQVRIT